MSTHALRTLLRLREEARRHSLDNRASASLDSDTHTTRDPAALLNDFLDAANPNDATARDRSGRTAA